jgi:hypothetical protein
MTIKDLSIDEENPIVTSPEYHLFNVLQGLTDPLELNLEYYLLTDGG